MQLRSWRRALQTILVAVVVIPALGACTPTPQVVAPAAPAASPPPAATGSPGGQVNWQAEWDKTLAAARREGKLLLAGPPGENWRDALTAFQADYPEITVEYVGLNSRDFFPRMLKEHEAGQFLWDVRIGGTDSPSFSAKNQGVLDPIQPLLIRPEVTDDASWLGGLDSIFLDNEQRYIPAFLAYETTVAYVNRDLVPEADFSSAEQLLDPRWRGRISIQDPRGGAGLLILTGLLRAYGESFVRDLLTTQDVVVTGDNRQQAEWLARGRYPIGIGVSTDILRPLQREGVGLNVKRLQGGVGLWTSGFGTIQLLNRRPHPHATTVFIHWLLSPAVQARLPARVNANSRRLDVPAATPELAIDPTRMETYINLNREEFLPSWDSALRLGQELLK